MTSLAGGTFRLSSYYDTRNVVSVLNLNIATELLSDYDFEALLFLIHNEDC